MQQLYMCHMCISPGTGRRHNTPLKSIPVGEAFECIRMDIKEMNVSKKWQLICFSASRLLNEMPRGVCSPCHHSCTLPGRSDMET